MLVADWIRTRTGGASQWGGGGGQTKQHNSVPSTSQLNGFAVHAMQLELVWLDLPLGRNACKADWRVVVLSEVLDAHQFC